MPNRTKDQVRAARVRPLLRRVIVMLVAAVSIVAGSVSIANATVYTATNTYVSGHGDWTWGKHTLSNVSLSVLDRQCNGTPVEIQVQVKLSETEPNAIYNGAWHENARGCNLARSWSGLSMNQNADFIYSVRVRACEVGVWNCVVSPWHDNPLI
ncbi:MAG: hypothetical protein J2P17_18670 [Mycobacterium sp.]|nr:hypothetical protein [Mycobacterium sp.]